MGIHLYKLEFRRSVRFGADSYGEGLSGVSMSAHSDTLFSALCHEWKNCFGESGLEEFIQYAKGSEFRLSDLMPYMDTETDSHLFVPKPVVHLERKKSDQETPETESLKKKMKKISFIRVDQLRDYLEGISQGKPVVLEQPEFGLEEARTLVSHERSEEPTPYYVSSFAFHKNCGLYFLVSLSEPWKEKMDYVLESLGLSGIGGKRSSGFGQFVLHEEPYEIGQEDGELLGIYDSDLVLSELLTGEHALYMAVSVVAPDQKDLERFRQEESGYTVLRRSGFVQSVEYAETQEKRMDLYVLGSGSCFPEKLNGSVLQVGRAGAHPVYRYAKGMYLGVSL